MFVALVGGNAMQLITACSGVQSVLRSQATWDPEKVQGTQLQKLRTSGYWRTEKRNVAFLLGWDGAKMHRSRESSFGKRPNGARAGARAEVESVELPQRSERPRGPP